MSKLLLEPELENSLTPEGQVVEALFQIANKQGEKVDYKLNHFQRKLDGAFYNLYAAGLPPWVILPKPRQGGGSAYMTARFLARCISLPNRRARIIAHETPATQKLLGKVKYYMKHIKGTDPPRMSYNSKNEIYFPTTDSSFAIYTAGNDDGFLGDTITDLHCSEIASWPDPKGLMSKLLPAVPRTAEVCIESTGGALGTYYHKRCMQALAAKGRFKLLFIGWLEIPEYALDLTPEQEQEIWKSLDPSLEEGIAQKAGATAPQIAWRREILGEMDNDLREFKIQYPLTLEEAFQPTEENFFQKYFYIGGIRWYRDPNEKSLWRLEGHPMPDKNYALGADVGGGVKKDYSTIELLCLETNEQVGEYRNNLIAPDLFALKIEEIGKLYNWPLAVVESNNHGITTLDNLRWGDYPQEMIYWDNQASNNITKSGFKTNARTKPLELGRLRKFLREGLKIYSEELIGELAVFTEAELAAPAGAHDDLVMALMMAHVALQNLWRYVDFDNPLNNPSIHNGKAEQGQFNLWEHLFGVNHEGQPIDRPIVYIN